MKKASKKPPRETDSKSVRYFRGGVELSIEEVREMALSREDLLGPSAKKRDEE